MDYNKLLEFISSLKSKLEKGWVPPNEAVVSTQIVLPVLGYLNWDIHDFRYVYPQYPLDKLKVDYGLKISPGEEKGLRCIIEVKAWGNLEGNTSADRQLFGYAFLAGAPIAVLTDGGRWRFYLPMAAGDFEERLVRDLDVEKHQPEKVVQGLVDYLSFENTRSGKAKKNAERDHEERIRNIEINKNISKAWKNLLDGPSDRLVTLLVDETSRISSGYPPVRADVEKFLKNTIDPQKGTELQTITKPFEKKAAFVLLSKPYTEIKNPTDAFIQIMNILADRDGNFLPRLAPKTERRKYAWLSKNLANIGEERDQKVARKLPGGWLLGTHASTSEKIKRLQTACKIAGIPFGKPEGLKVNFPSTSKKSRNRKK